MERIGIEDEVEVSLTSDEEPVGIEEEAVGIEDNVEVSVSTVDKVLPPNQQFALGVDPNDVVCEEGLELIFKSTDGSPVCVRPGSVTKLIERGWGSYAHVQGSFEEDHQPESTPEQETKSDILDIPTSDSGEGVILSGMSLVGVDLS